MEKENNKYLEYAIICSKETSEIWNEVIQILTQKYIKFAPQVFLYKSDLEETLPLLRTFKPKYSCFLTQPHEISPPFYKALHELVRKIDENSIYSSTIFSVLTGPDLKTVLKIASFEGPLNISSVLSGTKLNLSAFCEGYVYSELKQGLTIHREANGEIKESSEGPSDPTETMVNHLNSNKIDLMLTSGHATEKDWQIGFRYPAGCFTLCKASEENTLIGQKLDKTPLKIQSSNPKVYLGCGNCLIGNIKEPSCMALAWMKSGSAVQFAGYTVPTWFGFAGWGLLKYFLQIPGTFSLSEAYFANLQILNFQKKEHEQPKMNKQFLKGLEFDQNVFMLYGDPKFHASITNINIKNEILPYKMSFTEVKPSIFEWEVVCNVDCTWECPIADDKDTVPGRPPFWIFKERMEGKMEILEGEIELTDLFMFMRLKGTSKQGALHRAIFKQIK